MRTYLLPKATMALHHGIEVMGNKIVEISHNTLLDGKLQSVAFIAGHCHDRARPFEEIPIDPWLFYYTKLVAELLDILVMLYGHIPATATLLLPRLLGMQGCKF